MSSHCQIRRHPLNAVVSEQGAAVSYLKTGPIQKRSRRADRRQKLAPGRRDDAALARLLHDGPGRARTQALEDGLQKIHSP